MCVARSPEGPGAENLGNEYKALRTSEAVNVMLSAAANVGLYIKSGPFGWRLSSWAIVVGVTGRRAESCVRFAAALLMFPSRAARNTWSLHASSNSSS